ncbi:MAG: hypothetical protein NVS4B3_02010 [Gemmatimonadaceae bacterium]
MSGPLSGRETRRPLEPAQCAVGLAVPFRRLTARGIFARPFLLLDVKPMRFPSFLRRSYAAAIALTITSVGCTANQSQDARADRTGAASSTATNVQGPAGGPMHMGTPMVDSAMAMLHGFCATEGGGRASGGAIAERRIELVVGGEAVHRATRITVTSDSTGKRDLTAELTAGSDAHAMCAGAASTILIGGTAMFLGSPTLTITSGIPVTVLARTVYAQPLAGPVQIRPGQRGVVLAWGGTRP